MNFRLKFTGANQRFRLRNQCPGQQCRRGAGAATLFFGDQRRLGRRAIERATATDADVYQFTPLTNAGTPKPSRFRTTDCQRNAHSLAIRSTTANAAAGSGGEHHQQRDSSLQRFDAEQIAAFKVQGTTVGDDVVNGQKASAS